MELEAGQVWQLDTQEEFDAFVKLKDEQGIRWSYAEWTFEYLMEQGKSNKLEVSICPVDKVDKVYNSPHKTTHYGKDLLKEDNMFKVGDRVKVVKATDIVTGAHVGLEGEVTFINKKGNIIVDVGDVFRCSHRPEGLQLINQPKWQEVEREENIGSENGTLIVVQNTETKELRVTRGCFTGTLDEFEAAVKRKSEGDKWRIVYEWLIEKYKAKYPDYKKEELKWVVRGAQGEGYFGKFIDVPKHDEAWRCDAKEFVDLKQAELVAELIGGTVEEVEL